MLVMFFITVILFIKINQKTIEIIKVVNHVILVVDALVGYTHTDETIFNQILKMNIAFSVFIFFIAINF